MKTEFIDIEKTISLDFDGTVVGHTYPGIGKDIGAIPVLKELVENGCRLILWTMRGTYDSGLEDAKNWFKENDIPLFGIQTNPYQGRWTNSPKPHSHLIIDDTALGIPLRYDSSISDRPFVDWTFTRDILIEKGFLKK